MGIRVYKILPVPAPRMTRRDKWMKPPRPAVGAYFFFRDQVRALGVKISDGDHITFNIPMPPSWSAKKRTEFNGKPHRNRPDLDNMLKALMDAVFGEDAHIFMLSIEKRWSEMPSIVVERAE